MGAKKYFNLSNIIFVLLLYPFIAIFKLGGVYIDDGLTFGGYLLYYEIIAMYAILKLFIHRNTKNIKEYRIWASLLFLFIISHYVTLSRHGIDAKFCLSPLIVWAPLTIIYFLTKINELRYICMFCFIAIPLFFSISSFIKEKEFIRTCEKQTPSIQYNPIYLPQKFFHHTDDGMQPNIVEVDGKYDENKEWISYLDERLYKDYNNQILIYKSCKKIEKIKNILKDVSVKNVILCGDSYIKDVSPNIRQFTTTLNLVKDYEYLPLVTIIQLSLTEDPFWGVNSFKKGKKVTRCNYEKYKNKRLLQVIKENDLYNQFIKIKEDTVK